ncbi:MAG: translocation protein TolB [Candidatus Aminicenantes bacterium]|nr:translocation protein TolB [Candidatus Aminicenantes bacterium]
MKKLFTLFVMLVPLTMLGNILAQQSSLDIFQKALAKETAEGNLEEAIALYQKVVETGEDEALAAQAQLHIGMCYEKLGLGKARQAYETVIERFPKQADSVRAAQKRLARLQKPAAAEKDDGTFRMRLVTSDIGPMYGAVSPDGMSLAVMDPQSLGLSFRDLETGQTRRLNNSQGMFLLGRWSPDGKTLAYAVLNSDYRGETRLVKADGSEPRVLFKDDDYDCGPVGWSPDGKSILAWLQKKNSGYQLIVMSAADGSFQVLKAWTRPIPSWNMGFSPDGKYITYDAPQRENSKEYDIFLLSRDTKQETRLVDHPAHDTFLGWVPNTDALLFTSDRAVSRDLWVIRAADGKPLGEPVLVKKDIGDIKPLGFSGKGSFFYGTGSSQVDIYEAGIDLDNGAIVGPPQKLSQKIVSPFYSPVWSPDGTSLAYFVERSEGGKASAYFICVRPDNEEGKERWIPIEISAKWELAWSADGRAFLATVQDHDRNQGLFRIDRQNGGLTLLAKSGPGSLIKTFAVSADGKSVFYAHFQWQEKLCTVIQHDLATGQEKEIYRKEAGADIGSLMVSQDARYLSFSTADSTADNKGFVVRIMDLADGRTRDILRGKVQEHVPHVWTRDNKSILYIQRTGEANKQQGELWLVPAAGGEPKSLGLSMPGMHRLRLHPDGKSIVFTSEKVVLGVWEMENFLPKGSGR